MVNKQLISYNYTQRNSDKVYGYRFFKKYAKTLSEITKIND